MRRVTWVAVSVLLVALIALPVWCGLPPHSPMFAALGLPGPAANAGGRHCSAWHRQTRLGSIPLRSGTCTAADPRSPINIDRVSYDRLTHRIDRIDVLRVPPDSATWYGQFDSIAAAITARGGAPIVCSPPHASLTHITMSRVWRFEAFDVRLTASHFRAQAPRGPQWLLDLQGFAPRAPECDARAAPA